MNTKLNDNQEFFNLLVQSEKLASKQKTLLEKDEKAFVNLLNFVVVIEENLHCEEKISKTLSLAH